MSRLVRRIIFIFIVLIAVMIAWNDFTGIKNDKDKLEPDFPQKINLSAFPDDIAESLELLEQKVLDKRNELNTRGFHLDILSLNKGKRIHASSPLIIQTYYSQSKEMVEKVTAMPVSFIGLTTKELSNLTNDWNVKEYNPEKGLILYRKVDGLSPEDKKTMHLGIRDGQVAIFYGKTGSENLKQLTEIKVSDLPYSEQQALEEGIIVHSQSELLAVLEGLMSIIED